MAAPAELADSAPPGGWHGDLAPAEERGELRIDPRVVKRIAAAAATEVPHVGGAARRVLNMTMGSDTGAEHAQVDAHVDGGTVTVQVLCSISYPWPVPAVTEQLRTHLMTRVDELTGLSTRQVDITVTTLTTTTPSTGRTLA